MHRPSLISGAVLALAAGIALAACGSSSSSSASTSASSGGSASTSSESSSSAAISIPGNSDFCTQLVTAVSQFGKVASSFVSASPGATPDVNGIKSIIAAEAGLLDQLDSSAPSEIAPSFHTLKAAFDAASGQVQSATTLQQLGAAFSAFNTPAVTSAGTTISAYAKNSCGLSSTTTST